MRRKAGVELLRAKVARLEQRVLNAQTLEAARFAHDLLDKARADLERFDPCAQASHD
jgi:hypothetical protein